jgi:mRNA interferase MazF
MNKSTTFGYGSFCFLVQCLHNMQKDFDSWNEVKKKTDTEVSRLYTVREIWWCRLGVNVGKEQDGKGDEYTRPGVILRGFGADACLIVPLTTSLHEHALRIPVGLVEGQQARANLSQIRVVDTRRLTRKVGFLDKVMFVKLRKAARDML